MSSGYFLLNRGTIGYAYSLKKVEAIGMTILEWNFLYNLLEYAKHGMLNRDNIKYIIKIPSQCVKSFVGKGVFWQFWFLGALIIIYLLLPVISNLSDINKKRLLVGLGGTAVLIQIASMIIKYPIQKNIIQTFRVWTWMFYFMLGGSIKGKRVFENLTVQIHGMVLAFCTMFLIGIQLFISMNVMAKVEGGFKAEFFYDSFLEMLWIIVGFTLLLKIEIPHKLICAITSISKMSMGVYIVHPLIIRILSKFIVGSTFVGASLLFGVTLLASMCTALIMKKIPLVKKLIEI